MKGEIATLAVFLTVTALALGAMENGASANSQASARSLPYPPGDVRNCRQYSAVDPSVPLYHMEVLPGGGFDNLRNIDMGQVHFYNYSKCRKTGDGKYLLPDSVFAVPHQESSMKLFSEFFEHWDDYTSSFAFSINIGVDVFSMISGKFSFGYQSVKSHQVMESSQTTRVQLRQNRYAIKLQPDSQLHPTFKSELFDIAANIQNGYQAYAEYLAELLVRDYGTHYTTSVDAGAAIVKTDQLRNQYVQNMYYYKTSVTQSASVNLMDMIGLSFSEGFQFSVSQADIAGYIDNRTYSEILTAGGPPMGSNFSVDAWLVQVPDSLVAIDRQGLPLHYVINPTTLPELPEITVRQVSDTVYKTIHRYYRVNTRYGCTDPTSKNFDFHANVNSSKCKDPNTNYTFGGIYQTCERDTSYNGTEDLCVVGPNPGGQLNPLTGDYSCPKGYTSIMLHSGTLTHVVQKPTCNNVCHHCGFLGLSRCCQCLSVLKPFLSVAHYAAYWCVALGEVDKYSGYLFGGVYTSLQSNPFTKAMVCPPYFIPLHFGQDIKVCVSDDYELGYEFSVPFSGFESCLSGNPLAASKSQQNSNNTSKWPHGCPAGYSQHLITVDEGCEIDYCVIANAFKTYTPLPAKLPPYRKRPQYAPNATETLVVFGVYGEIWYKDSNGKWVLDTNHDISGQDLLEGLESNEVENGEKNYSEGGLPNSTVAVVSVVLTLVLGLGIIIIAFAGFSFFKRRRNLRKKSSYMAINDGSEPRKGAPFTESESHT